MWVFRKVGLSWWWRRRWFWWWRYFWCENNWKHWKALCFFQILTSSCLPALYKKINNILNLNYYITTVISSWGAVLYLEFKFNWSCDLIFALFFIVFSLFFCLFFVCYCICLFVCWSFVFHSSCYSFSFVYYFACLSKICCLK